MLITTIVETIKILINNYVYSHCFKPRDVANVYEDFLLLKPLLLLYTLLSFRI